MLSLSAMKVVLAGSLLVGGGAIATGVVLTTSGPLANQSSESATATPTPPTPTIAVENEEPPSQVAGVALQTLRYGADVPTNEFALVVYTRSCFACDQESGVLERIYQTAGGDLVRETLLEDVLFPGTIPAVADSAADITARACTQGYCGWAEEPAGNDPIVTTYESDDAGVTWAETASSDVVSWESGNTDVTSASKRMDSPLALADGSVVSISDDRSALEKQDGSAYFRLPSDQVSIAFARRIPGSDAIYLLLSPKGADRWSHQALLRDGAIQWVARADQEDADQPRLYLTEGFKQLIDDSTALAVEEAGADVHPVLVDLESGTVHRFQLDDSSTSSVPVFALQGPVTRVTATGCLKMREQPSDEADPIGCYAQGVLLTERTDEPQTASGWIPVQDWAGRAGWMREEFLAR